MLRTICTAIALGFGLVSPVIAAFAIFATGLSNAGLTAVNITTYATCDGTADDTSGWAAFVAANQGGNVVLTIPNGKTCCFLSGIPELAKGINFLRVLGSGATLTNQCGATTGTSPYFLGPAGATDTIQENNTTSSAVQTVSAGASFVTLVTAAETARFTVGRWALLGGLDLQGYGYPPNMGFHDFVFVTAKDGGCQGTGTVCFLNTITSSYKSTWPDYGASNPPVGPARMYALGAAWGGSVEWRGLTITAKSAADGKDIQLGTAGYSTKFIDATFTGNSAVAGRSTCPFAGTNVLFQLSNVAGVNCEIEMDKNVDQVLISSLTTNQVTFQSSSVKLATINLSTISHLAGTPISTTLSNSSITNFMQLGATAYGASTSINYLTLGNTIASTQDIGAGESNVDTKANPWTMSGGVMMRSIANIVADTGAVNWAVPGHSYNFTGVGCAPCAFAINDIVQSGANVQITTNLGGGFPGSALTVTVAPVTRN